MMRRLFGILSLLVLAGAGLVAVAPAAQAEEALRTSVTMIGNNDYIAGNNAWYWRTGDGTISVGGTPSSTVSVNVAGGSHGVGGCCGMSISFAAPPGETLAVGHYSGAQRTPFRDEGHPGIDVSGDGRGCNTVSGEFTVLDMAPDLSRLWVMYDAHCEGGSGSTFGEIRYNMPTDADLEIVQSRIDWPDSGANLAARKVPVILVNTSSAPITVSAASVTTGGDAFSVASNGCTTLAVGAYCTIQVGYRPPDVGNHTGALTINDTTAAGSRTIPLSGTGKPVPVSLAVTTGGKLFDYGKPITLRAKLAGTYGVARTVRFWRQYGSGPKALLGSRTVDPNGIATLQVPARERSFFFVEWTDGVQTKVSPKVYVLVRAKVSLTMSRWFRTSGRYHLYRPGARVVTRAVVLPAQPGKCIYFNAEIYARGAWRALARTSCLTMGAGGGAAAYLPYDATLLNRSLRFYTGWSGNYRAERQQSPYRYARYVR